MIIKNSWTKPTHDTFFMQVSFIAVSSGGGGGSVDPYASQSWSSGPRHGRFSPHPSTGQEGPPLPQDPPKEI